MQCRNHKYFIHCVLSLLCSGVLLTAAGCSDNPEDAASKRVSQKTIDVVETSVKEKNYDAAQQQVIAVMVDRDNKDAGGGSKDTAVLASGNLAMARGRRMMSDLELSVWKKADPESDALPLQDRITEFENVLRSSEQLLLEKQQIENLLAGGQQEMEELRQLLAGGDGQPGLRTQADEAQAELTRLLDRKNQLLGQKDEVQTVLDDYQSRAAGFARKAEMAQGDEKLNLEKQGFAILQERKQYYIQAQSIENEVAVLDGQIELAQAKADGLNRSVQETEGRIEAIDNSQTRIALKRQMHEVGQTIGVNQQKMTAQAQSIRSSLDAYKAESRSVCEVFEEAAGEFERVRSRQAQFAVKLGQADSYHYAALTCSSSIKVQKIVSERLEDLMVTAEPTFADALRQKLPIQTRVDAELSQKVMDFFDKAIVLYGEALDSAGAIGQETECNVLKSQLLSVDAKMLLANALGLNDVTIEAAAKREELIEKGNEYGVSFTQSETKKLLDFGIDYKPSLPVNLDVFAEDLEKRFVGWKALPVSEQEAEVDANLMEIDKLVEKYGEELARRMEPLKQEMLAARERGFKEEVIDIEPDDQQEAPAAPGRGFGGPVGGIPGEPNSI